jgi:hypothetical protein
MIELNGKYELTNLVGVGQPVRHSLTRDGDRLRGYELTNDGMRLPWFLRRIRQFCLAAVAGSPVVVLAEEEAVRLERRARGVHLWVTVFLL